MIETRENGQDILMIINMVTSFQEIQNNSTIPNPIFDFSSYNQRRKIT